MFLICAILLAVMPFFSTDGTMEGNGWTTACRQPEDEFSVKDGELTCRCSPNPMNGCGYSREIDFPSVGEMSFEVKLFVSGYTDRYVLYIDIGKLRMSFSRRDVLRYYRDGNAKRPNWVVVGRDCVPKREWTKVRIAWNTTKKTLKYYVGKEQSVPSYVDHDVVIMPYGNDVCSMAIGNYGLHKDHEIHMLRNFAIRAVDDAADDVDVVRDAALVFHGVCAEYFPIAEWTKGFAAEKIVNFRLECVGYNYSNENRFSLSGYPDEAICRRAQLIILCDMPLDRKMIPYECQEYMLDAVKSGATMLVTGGFAGLQRCGDFESPIAKALPISLVSAFAPPQGGEEISHSYGRGKISVLNQSPVKRKEVAK